MSILLACFFAFALAQGGLTDIYGNYYDHTTGQLSTIDGRVYNPAVPVIPAPYLGYNAIWLRRR